MRLRGLCAAATLALFCVAPAAPSPQARAQDAPDPALENAQYWLGARGPDELELSLVRASEAHVGQSVAVTLRLENTSESAVDNLQVTARRGDAVDTTTQARQQLAAGAYQYYGPSGSSGSLEPGESREVTLEVPTALGDESTLAITDPGAYPLLFTLTGTRDGEAASFAEERVLLDVLGDPAQHEPAADSDSEAEERHQFSLIYPVTAQLDVVPGDTGGQDLILESENLAGQFAPGGRLDQLVETYLSHDLHGSGCMAVDPALLDVADRMAAGYTVNPSRPSIAQRPKRLRDSWFSASEQDRGDPGTGSADAAAWLDKMRTVDCTMLLPWANANTDAVAEANNAWLTHEALERGADTVSRILGTTVNSELTAPASGTTAHEFSVPLVVADNSTWVGNATTFDSSLGALLAESGSMPQTVGYSNPELRYDFAEDSEQARALTAGASISVAAAQEDQKDMVAKLPNYLDPAAARSVMETTQRLLDAGQLDPRPVTALPIKSAQEGPDGEPGSPYPDPAAFREAEIAQVAQQARYTDELMSIMVNEPSIALTRYGFTLPLRRDLLIALSDTTRTSLRGNAQAARASRERLQKNSDALRDLRSSVSLIPPGNVYTRVSESSPLLIVAENGLPLPVDAHLAYDAPDGATLSTQDSVHIPAKGSITVSMTADLPSDMDRTSLRLWLATPTESDGPAGHLISEPIDITVQTRAGIVSVYGVGIVAALALALAALFRLGRRKKKKSHG